MVLVHVLGAWAFRPGVTLVLAAMLFGYLTSVRRVNRRHPTQPWPVRNTVVFVTAIALAVITLLGPIGALDRTFFWAHMVQHLVLMMIVAPLLLLGQPVLLLLRVASRSTRHDRIIPIIRSQALTWLTNPVVSWVLFATVLLAAHFSGLHEFSLEHPLVQAFVERPLYLFAGLVYYYPLLGNNPCRTRVKPMTKVISLFLMMLPETMVGFAIYMASGVMYPHYLTEHHTWGPGSALVDQRLGGAIMWASGMVIDAAWITVAALQWIRSEEHRAKRIDLELRAEFDLD